MIWSSLVALTCSATVTAIEQYLVSERYLCRSLPGVACGGSRRRRFRCTLPGWSGADHPAGSRRKGRRPRQGAHGDGVAVRVGGGEGVTACPLELYGRRRCIVHLVHPSWSGGGLRTSHEVCAKYGGVVARWDHPSPDPSLHSGRQVGTSSYAKAFWEACQPLDDTNVLSHNQLQFCRSLASPGAYVALPGSPTENQRGGWVHAMRPYRSLSC